MGEVITVNSVSEYVDVICKQNLILKESEKYQSLLFRGQPDKEKELIPSLGRRRNLTNSENLISEENNMVEMARYKLPSVFRRELEPIELLALLQHHGIPTRLLDVSANGLVGLYFACHGTEENENDDGEVIVFKASDVDINDYSMINTICYTYKHIYHKNQDVLSRLYEICKNPIFTYAPSFSLRQNIQSGRYILFANKIVKNGNQYEMLNSMEPISKDSDSIASRIIIPASAKKSIRRDLRLLGISKELLFLDNTDMVCREIKDRFTER